MNKIIKISILAEYKMLIMWIKINVIVDKKQLNLCEKNYKKLLTNVFPDGIVLLVLEKRANKSENFLKKMLTKKNSFDKIKKSKGEELWKLNSRLTIN